MMENNDTKTFKLTVSGTEDHEMQGTVQMPDGRTKQFRSVLELVMEMDAELCKSESAETQQSSGPESSAGGSHVINR